MKLGLAVAVIVTCWSSCLNRCSGTRETAPSAKPSEESAWTPYYNEKYGFQFDTPYNPENEMSMNDCVINKRNYPAAALTPSGLQSGQVHIQVVVYSERCDDQKRSAKDLDCKKELTHPESFNVGSTPSWIGEVPAREDLKGKAYAFCTSRDQEGFLVTVTEPSDADPASAHLRVFKSFKFVEIAPAYAPETQKLRELLKDIPYANFTGTPQMKIPTLEGSAKAQIEKNRDLILSNKVIVKTSGQLTVLGIDNPLSDEGTQYYLVGFDPKGSLLGITKISGLYSQCDWTVDALVATTHCIGGEGGDEWDVQYRFDFASRTAQLTNLLPTPSPASSPAAK